MKTCDVCGGLGWFRRDESPGSPDFGKLHPCACRAQERIAQLAALSGLKEHETHALGELCGRDNAANQMIRQAQGFAQNPRGWLFLWGGPGNGKTLVLQGVVNKLTKAGVPALYTTFSDLLDLMRETFGKNASEDYGSRFKRVQSVQVLAIDEFEKVNETGFVWEFRSKLIDHRYRDAIGGETATLFASNADPATLPDWIFSRVNDGRFTVFHNQGGDVRPSAQWNKET